MKSVEVYWKPHCNTKEMPEHSLQFQFFLFSVESVWNQMKTQGNHHQHIQSFIQNIVVISCRIRARFILREKRTHTHTYTYFLMPASHPVPMNKSVATVYQE